MSVYCPQVTGEFVQKVQSNVLRFDVDPVSRRLLFENDDPTSLTIHEDRPQSFLSTTNPASQLVPVHNCLLVFYHRKIDVQLIALVKRRCRPLIATRNSESMLDLELIQQQQHQCVEFVSSRRARGWKVYVQLNPFQASPGSEASKSRALV
jgi:hypothetical protein